MPETFTGGYRNSALDQLSPDNRDWLLGRGRYAPRYTAADPTMPPAAPASPSGSSMPADKVRQLREWGCSVAQIDDLARLTPDELAKLWPTPAELEANDKMGPNGPGVVALIAHKAEQAGIKLPPDFAPAGAAAFRR